MPFVVYKSSAGSGKTYTLVREYLRLILPDPENFRHILAITFTNKAANEMRERILENLNELASPQEKWKKSSTKGLMEYLSGELNLSEKVISSRSKNALTSILHGYSDFSIGTIDSFSHRIIRTFAHDFKLPVNFNVELESDDLLTTAIDLLISKVGEDHDLTELLIRFLETRMDDEKDWNIEDIIFTFSRNLLEEDGYRNIAKLKDLTSGDFIKIASVLRKEIRKFEDSVQALSRQVTDMIRSESLDNAAFFGGPSGISRYFEKLAAGNFAGIIPGSNVLKTIREGKWTSGKASPADLEAILRINVDIEKCFNEVQRIYDKDANTYFLFQTIERTIFPMAVLNLTGQLLEDFKKQNSIVHISEFNKRISGFIMNEPVPYIYERLGEKFRHLLIDEFQDTSILQWHNLLPLVENALASGFFNLVVGDGKQAIYRWRNGDVGQFISLPAIQGSSSNTVLSDRERILRDHYSEEKLDTNYRSGKAIISFNNDLFSDLKTLLGQDTLPVYSGHEQKSGTNSCEGYVSLAFLQQENEGNTYREQVSHKMLEILKSIVDEGFRKRDVAILCRTNTEASEFAQFLLSEQVDVVSSESLLICSSKEVRFLEGWIRFMLEPENTIYCAELLTWLWQNGKIHADSLESVLCRIPETMSMSELLYSLLKENEIDIKPSTLDILPVYDLVEELIMLFALNSKVNPYIQFFLDQILRFSRKNSTTKEDFLEWWDKNKNKLSLILPEGLDAVRIMTMHKAKGLQFPVVIIPFMKERFRPTKQYLWVDLDSNRPGNLPAALLETTSQLENTEFAPLLEAEQSKTLLDYLNLFYVALTRPEERLYIFSPFPPAKGGSQNTAPAFFQRFLKNQGKWNDQCTVYEFGKKEKARNKMINESVRTIELKQFNSSNWHEKIFIRKLAPVVWDIDNPSGKRGWGNLLHEILSKISYVGQEVDVLNELSADGSIDDQQRVTISKKLQMVFANPEINAFFAPGLKVRNETEIIDQKGNSYRPDRIIFKDQEAVIIDFKTGNPAPHHQDQLNRYGKLLNELGYQSIRKYLLYLDPEVCLTEVK